MESASPAPVSSGINSFYTTVLVIAIVVLILTLGFLGWVMSKQKATDNFPKLQTSCPDYWGVITENGKAYCKQPVEGQVNYGNSAATSAIGYDSTNQRFDFSNAGWSAEGGNAICAKKKWANKYGINWDTVTNYNAC